MNEQVLTEQPRTLSMEHAMRYVPNEVFRSAASLAANGMKVVKLFGIRDDGSCTCSKGHECSSAGKHPAGAGGWQHRATDDEKEIASWFEECGDDVRWNIGVRLGRTSGIIDIEADDEQAMNVIRRYRLDKIDTPAFKGSRGPHYIFQFDTDLPDAGVTKVDGLECRLGGGEAASQSVFPKSWHRSGAQYEWLPGRSLDEVKPAPLPEAFKAAIIAAAGGKKGGGCIREAREALGDEEPIEAGHRHRFLLGVASDLFYKEPKLDEDAKQRTLTFVRSLNKTKCSTPKPDSEVVDIVEDQYDFYRRARASGHHDLRGDAPNARQELDQRRSPWEKVGLQKSNGQWSPGDWRVDCVHSDPRRYRLKVKSPDSGEMVTVNMTTDDWMSPAKVAKRILEATGTVNMNDPSPGQWAKAWDGHSERNGGAWEARRGLAAQMLEPPFVSHEYPPPELSRAAAVACLLYDNLARPRKPADQGDSKPSDAGSANWVRLNGRLELLFNWATVWKEISDSAETPVTQAEKQNLTESLLKSLGLSEFRKWQPNSPTRKRYLRWDDDHLRALARLAGLE
jgi:hypothetical protein